MIKLLRIKNIALVTEVELEVGEGLTLFTGETGAGKSILVDSLGLLLGVRGSADLVRTGAERAAVEALVECPEAGSWLESRGLSGDGDELVIRREIGAGGRGRATVNGVLSPVSVLRELAPWVGAIHGQHEPRGLLDPDTHLGVLDEHAGLGPLVAALAAPYGRLREAEAGLAALRGDRREVERRREVLDYQLREIDAAQLQAEEDDSLRQEKRLLANAGRVAALAEEAYGALYDEESAVTTRLGGVLRRVAELAEIDPRFAAHLEAAAAARAQLDELALFLRDYRQGIDASPGRLDEVESRLALVERLKRKYGASVAEILDFAEACRRELAGLGSPEEREAALEAERQAAARTYLSAARDVSSRRRQSARDLEKLVEAELGRLAMERTRFRVGFEPPDVPEGGGDTARWTERGLERAEFMLSPNPGEELRPLARIASGGELSRILLALKSVARGQDAGRTLVFDEVDAGVGGRVAEAVGRRLKDLAARHQVLCVTHVPQIAALADHHFAVSKHVRGGRTFTEVRKLDEEGRVEEIARMIGGARVTDSARRHAREMITQTMS